MDFRIIKTVISREYTTRVKKKSFLVTTFLVPIHGEHKGKEDGCGRCRPVRDSHAALVQWGSSHIFRLLH